MRRSDDGRVAALGSVVDEMKDEFRSKNCVALQLDLH